MHNSLVIHLCMLPIVDKLGSLTELGESDVLIDFLLFSKGCIIDVLFDKGLYRYRELSIKLRGIPWIIFPIFFLLELHFVLKLSKTFLSLDES